MKCEMFEARITLAVEQDAHVDHAKSRASLNAKTTATVQVLSCVLSTLAYQTILGAIMRPPRTTLVCFQTARLCGAL